MTWAKIRSRCSECNGKGRRRSREDINREGIRILSPISFSQTNLSLLNQSLSLSLCASEHHGRKRIHQQEAQRRQRRRCGRRCQEEERGTRHGPRRRIGPHASRVRGARRRQHVHRGLRHVHGHGARDPPPNVRRRVGSRPRLLHLQPPLQPHSAEPGPPHGRHGRHRGRLLHLQRHVRHLLRPLPALQLRRTRGGLQLALRRYPRPALAFLPQDIQHHHHLRGH